MKEWDPEVSLRNMVEEAAVMDESAPELSKRLLRDNAHIAAQALVHLAMYSDNEKIRLDAAEKILTRVHGRVDEGLYREDVEDPLATFTGQFVRDIEEFAHSSVAANDSDSERADEEEAD